MMPAFQFGDMIESSRDNRIHGMVIGYGTIQRPGDTLDDNIPQLVYLVQVRKEGSSTHGPAIAALRADITDFWEE